MRFLVFLAGVLSASLAHAVIIDLEPLRSNGAAFHGDRDGLPLRCLEEAGLLERSAQEQDALLDKASAAGFNAVSFDAALYGPKGFCVKLGVVDTVRLTSLRRLVESARIRHIYLFPVLWPETAAKAFIALSKSDEEAFYTNKTSLQWQTWLLRQVAQAQGVGQPLTQSVAVGAWMLYRGPWRVQPVEAAGNSKAAQWAPSMRYWAAWQVASARRAGFGQLLGMGFWPKQDLGTGVEDATPVVISAVAPVAELSGKDAAQKDPMALDGLPPVPGVKEGEDDGGAPGAPLKAVTPWDLEGVDWDAMEAFFQALLPSTHLDLIELTQDSEDWHHLGERLAGLAQGVDAPVLWRHDWRQSSRYERQKRLEAPESMAGLVGPWPVDDWPDEDENIWPPANGKGVAALFIREVKPVFDQKGAPAVRVLLSRAATVELRWGTQWPPTRVIASADEGIAQTLTLKGAKPGQDILVGLRARSDRFGRAAWATRWLRVPKR